MPRIRIISFNNGQPSEFDGEYVQKYNPVSGNITTTRSADQALDIHEITGPPVRSVLSAFTVEIQ